MQGQMMSENKRRLISMFWFGGVAFVAAGVFFYHRPIDFAGVALFVLLPALAAGCAGFTWGGRILDHSRTASYGSAALRGMGLTLGSYPIFAVFFAIGITLTDRGWNTKEIPGMFLMAITFGFVMTGAFMLLAGAIAGAGLYWLSRYVSRRSSIKGARAE